jgi:hypothetical protein
MAPKHQLFSSLCRLPWSGLASGLSQTLGLESAHWLSGIFMIAHQAGAYPVQLIRPMFTQGEDLLAYFLLLINGALWFGPTGFHASYRFLPGIPPARFWTFLQRFLYVAEDLSSFKG